MAISSRIFPFFGHKTNSLIDREGSFIDMACRGLDGDDVGA